MITTITPDQAARFKEFEQKWMRTGLSTEPCNVEAAKSAISAAYRQAGLEPPSLWLHSRCPIEAGLMVNCLKSAIAALQNEPGFNRAKVDFSQVRDSVWDSVSDSVWASVSASVWASVSDSVWDSVSDSVWDSVWASVSASVWASVRDSVSDSVWDSVYGNHEAAWLGYCDYMGEVLGVEATKKLRPIMDTAEHCGWWIPYRDVCVIQDRPSVIQLNDQGRIHCEHGPAISYRSGLLDIYAIHGVRVPRQVVMEPETLTVQQIKAESNAEIRRIMIDRLGVTRYAEQTHATVVDRDFVSRFPGDDMPMPRALLVLDDKSKWLVGTDGSTHRVYHMPVPDSVSSCKAAHEAISGRPDSAIKWQG